MTYFLKTHLILWLIASHLKTFTSTKRNQNGRNDLILVLFTLKSLCIQALALWQIKLPFSSLSLLSLFLSLLDCSLYWLYKTTFPQNWMYNVSAHGQIVFSLNDSFKLNKGIQFYSNRPCLLFSKETRYHVEWPTCLLLLFLHPIAQLSLGPG